MHLPYFGCIFRGHCKGSTKAVRREPVWTSENALEKTQYVGADIAQMIWGSFHLKSRSELEANQNFQQNHGFVG